MEDCRDSAGNERTEPVNGRDTAGLSQWRKITQFNASFREQSVKRGCLAEPGTVGLSIRNESSLRIGVGHCISVHGAFLRERFAVNRDPCMPFQATALLHNPKDDSGLLPRLTQEMKENE